LLGFASRFFIYFWVLLMWSCCSLVFRLKSLTPTISASDLRKMVSGNVGGLEAWLHVKDCCVQVFVSFVVVFEIFRVRVRDVVVVVFLCFWLLIFVRNMMMHKGFTLCDWKDGAWNLVQ
jgi:hypothetical protein